MNNNTVLQVDVTAVQTTIETATPSTDEAAAQPVDQAATHHNEVAAAESFETPSDKPAGDFEDSAKDFTENFVGRLKKMYTQHISNEPQKPRKFKLIYANTTPEAMFRGMVENGASVGLVADEAGSLFNGRGMNDLAMMNSMRDGSPIYVDRVGAGSCTVPDPRFTFMGMVQPGQFAKFMARRGEEARDIGFLPRNFFCFPTSTQGTRYIGYTNPNPQHLLKFQERITEILEQNLLDLENPAFIRPTLKFSPEATQLWVNSFNEIESFILAGEYFADISDYGSKFAENLARLAALLHYFSGEKGNITYETTNRALAICRWFMTEFKRIFGSQPEVPLEVLDANELEAWLVKLCNRYQGWTEIGKNVIAQIGPNQLRISKVRRDAAIYILACNNKLRVEHRGKTKVLVLNPACFPIPQVPYPLPYQQTKSLPAQH